MDTTDEQLLTIDGLARRTGMTTRNLRAYRERGLLPAPVMRGRTGYYGDEHIERVELVKRLHDQGFSLELIRKLLDADPETHGAVLRFAGVMGEPFTKNTPYVLDAATLSAITGLKTPELLERAVRVGMLRPLGGGRYATVSDRLVGVAGELAGLGVTAKDVVDGMGALRPHTDAIARLMLQWFRRLYLEAYEGAGSPPERLAGVRDAADRFRAVLPEIIQGLLELSLDDAFKETVERDLADP